MREYQRLSEESRNSRRTIADAIAVLTEEAGFGADDSAHIQIGLMPLPSSDVVGLVQIIFNSPLNEKAYIVSLPTSTRFEARRVDIAAPVKDEIHKLGEAKVLGTGEIILLDGTKLRAVEVKPAQLPLEPSKTDWRIAYHTIAVLGLRDRCFRSLKDGVPPNLREMIPDLTLLDCRSIRNLPIPLLKLITCEIRLKDRGLKKISEQQVANSLQKFGMRIPRARPRKRSTQAP